MSNEINVEKLESLTPKSAEDKEDYVKIIQWAIKQDDITNVALTGSYGSGKSSVLKTFKDKSKENDILEISVASFNSEYKKQFSSETLDSNSMEKSSSEEKPTIENLLEQYIMQQMFYRVSKEKIPLSRFSRINKNENNFKFIDIFTVILSAMIILIFLKYNLLDFFINDVLFDFEVKNIKKYIQLFLFLSSFGLVILGLYSLFSILRNISLKRVELGSTAIEINPKESHSIFNKYIDEILYFFTCTKYKTLIFEDLDRFESLEIFERLRDLNILLNNFEELEGRKIVFIYALRDDIFSKKDTFEEAQNRTKFFDFIIPTVKIVNSSNSEDILLENLKKENIEKSLISGVSLYINDMRLLKNICNEFYITKAALNNKLLENSRIFAMVVYKNIYPKDYMELLDNKGTLYSIFNSKKQFIENVIMDIEVENDELNTYLNNIPEVLATSSDELKILFLARRGVNSSEYYIEVDGKRFNITNTSEFERLMKYFIDNKEELKSKNVNVGSNYSMRAESYSKFATVNDKFTDVSTSYKSMEIKLNKREQETRRKISKNLKELNFIRSISIKELYIRYGSKTGIDFSGKELLKYLVTDGWIEENYNEYVTYYYAGVLPTSDLEYIKTFYGANRKEENFKLTNVSKILSKITGERLNRNEIFNHSLMRYVFLQKLNKEELLKRQIIEEYVDNNLEETIKFLNLYITEDTELKLIMEIIKSVQKNLKKLWNVIDEVIPYENKRYFMQVILEIFEEEDLKKINSDSNFTSFINDTPVFADWFIVPKNLNWGNSLESLDVKIKNIGMNETNEIIDVLIKYNLFEINKENINVLLNQPLNLTYKQAQKANIKLAERINDEINNFVPLLIEQSNYEEDEAEIVYLLNNTDIEMSLREELLGKWNGLLSSLKLLKEANIIEHSIFTHKALPTWDNIFTYFKNKDIGDMSEGIISFIIYKDKWKNLKEEYELRSFSDDEKEIQKILSVKILQSERMNEEDFIKLTFMLEPSDNIKIKNLTLNRIETLIDFKLLKFKEDYYNYIYQDIKNVKLAAKYLNIFTEKDISKFKEIVIETAVLNELLTITEVKNLERLYLAAIESNVNFSQNTVQILLSRWNSKEIKKGELIAELFDRSTSDSVKKILITTYISEINDFDDEIIKQFTEYFYENLSINLTKNEFIKLIINSSDEESVAILLNLGLDEYGISGDKYEELVKQLKTPHVQLAEKGKRGKEIISNGANLELIEQLCDKYHYVSSWTSENKIIKFNVSNNFKKWIL